MQHMLLFPAAWRCVCLVVVVGGGGVPACRFHLLGVPQDEPVAVQRQKPVRILN
jgi:hypothetical protein